MSFADAIDRFRANQTTTILDAKLPTEGGA